MSKQKVIVLSVTEQGLSISEAARRYGISRRWVHVLIRRYRDGGTPLWNRAPAARTTAPTRTPAPTADRILSLRRELTADGLDAGPATIAWHVCGRCLNSYVNYIVNPDSPIQPTQLGP